MKLGLGTVQFGLNYGITNQTGQTPLEEVRHCLAYADNDCVPIIDTAPLYGNSEQIIGKTLPRPHRFRIVTKTRPLEPSLSLAQALANVRDGVHQSLVHLGEHRASGLLIHHINDLLGPHGDALFKCIEDMKDAGIVEKIGVSLYTPNEARAVLARYPIDLVQLPLNPLDQRHLIHGTLQALAESGVEVHIRSIFLQGLLLAEPNHPPRGLAALAPALQSWHAFSNDQGLTPLAACLGFLMAIPSASIAVCGATRQAELREILAAYHTNPQIPGELLKHLAVADDNLIDPRYWPKC